MSIPALGGGLAGAVLFGIVGLIKGWLGIMEGKSLLGWMLIGVLVVFVITLPAFYFVTPSDIIQEMDVNISDLTSVIIISAKSIVLPTYIAGILAGYIAGLLHRRFYS